MKCLINLTNSKTGITTLGGVLKLVDANLVGKYGAGDLIKDFSVIWGSHIPSSASPSGIYSCQGSDACLTYTK